MNTPHEKLTRTTFSLPLGEVHALVGGAVNARPLLFLHGFPDHPPTAVPFLEHFAETHRVVAPWLRGYAPSPIVGPYDLDTLTADALALIDHLGDQVDLVGHDWGGEITYTVCAAAPSHVRRAVTLAHPATFIRSLASSKQWKKSWYMGLFQLPGAGYLVRRRELALIDRLWRAWSPSFTLDPARRDELHACLKRSLPAPLEYYRAIVRPLTTFVDRRSSHHRCGSRAGEPVHSIRRDCRLRFDSHLKEGIRIGPKVALQNPTHAHGQRFHYD